MSVFLDSEFMFDECNEDVWFYVIFVLFEWMVFYGFGIVNGFVVIIEVLNELECMINGYEFCVVGIFM